MKAFLKYTSAVLAISVMGVSAKAASTTFATFSAANVPNFSFSTGGTVGSAATLTFTQTVNLTLTTGFFDGLAPASDYILIPQQEFLGATITLTGFSAGPITDPIPLTEAVPETLLGSGSILVKAASGRTIFGGTVSDLNVVYFGGAQGGVNTVSGVVNYNVGDLAPVLTLPENFTFSLNDIDFGANPATNGLVISDFNATATGSFRSDSPGGIVSTPLPAAFAPGAGVLSLMALGLVARKRRVLGA
jgi:hypothetical protein